MKDEKFCFKKSTGFIALVGILLVGFVLFAQMSNTTTTSDTKASGGTGTKVINGVMYGRTQNDCFMASKCAHELSSAVAGYTYKCVSVGSCVGKDSDGESVNFFCQSKKSANYATNGAYEYELATPPEGINCLPQITPDPASGPKCTDRDPKTGIKGNWYQTSAYADCATLSNTSHANTKYVEKTPISDSRTGYFCCIPEAEPTESVKQLTQAAKKSARNNNMCFRTSVGNDCDTVSVKMQAPFAPIKATDPLILADCGDASLACKPVKNLCYGNIYFKSNGETYQVTGTYPNTFVMKNGKLACKVAKVSAPVAGQKVNTANRNICRDMNAANVTVTLDNGANFSSIVNASADTNGYCTY